MAQIDQIQVKFVPLEDRLLVRISTKDNAEYLFWMTRRFVRRMWPGLIGALARSPRIAVQASPEARQELLAFEHRRAVDAADFVTPYRGFARSHPLGPQPILLARLQIRPVDVRHAALSFGPESGPGLELTLNQCLLHSFTELLGNAVSRTDWDLGALRPHTAHAPHVPPPAVN